MPNTDTDSSATKALISLALEEDMAERGDITSQLFIPKGHTSSATIVTREQIVVAGAQTSKTVFHTVDPNLQVQILHLDGSRIGAGENLMTIKGSTHSILAAERVALNFLQRLSGIATVTRQYVNAAVGTGAQVLDTRKTTPGWRALEKAAVSAGGGRNHRMGLHDAIMIKDNHLVACGDPEDIAAAIQKARDIFSTVCIELEVESLEQLKTYLQIPNIDVILLDNMDPALLSEAVAIRNEHAPSVKLEASGGITLETIASIAARGVDFVSVGSLTHSVRAVDLSLELQSDV